MFRPKPSRNGFINGHFVGTSPEAKRINRAILKYARVDKHLLIVGAEGTGKRFVAQQIHAMSQRKSQPFVTFDCSQFGKTISRDELMGRETETSGAIQRTIGLLEKANGGVLYLDNLELAPDALQLILFQILSERAFRREGGTENIPLDVRVFSALTEDIEQDLERRGFRKGLYYWLKPLSVKLPSLKERRQDIPELMIFFLKRYCHENGLEIPAVPAEIFESMLEYEWKGNVRELKNCVEDLVSLSPDGLLSTKFLPFEVKRHPLDALEVADLTGIVADIEKYLIRKALGKFAGNQVKAARLLEIPEATLRFKIRKYDILKKNA